MDQHLPRLRLEYCGDNKPECTAYRVTNFLTFHRKPDYTLVSNFWSRHIPILCSLLLSSYHRLIASGRLTAQLYHTTTGSESTKCNYRAREENEQAEQEKINLSKDDSTSRNGSEEPSVASRSRFPSALGARPVRLGFKRLEIRLDEGQQPGIGSNAPRRNVLHPANE